MDAVDDALIFPQIEVVENRGLGRQILGNIAPLAPCAQDIHDPVGDLAQIDRTLAPAAFSRRNQRRDQRPFLIRHICLITTTISIAHTDIVADAGRKALSRCIQRSKVNNRLLAAFLLLLLLLPFLVLQIHLGLLYALAGSRYGLGA